MLIPIMNLVTLMGWGGGGAETDSTGGQANKQTDKHAD